MSNALGAIVILAGYIFAVLFFAILAAIILGFVFWIFMLVDAAKRKFKKDNEKVIWIIVLALTGIIGALIYYFAVKIRRKRR